MTYVYSTLEDTLEKIERPEEQAEFLAKVASVSCRLVKAAGEGRLVLKNDFEFEVAASLAKRAEEEGDEELAKSLWGAIRSGVTRGIGAARNAFSYGADAVRSGISRGIGAARNAFSYGADAVRSGISRGIDAARNAFSYGEDALKSGISRGIDAANQGMRAVRRKAVMTVRRMDPVRSEVMRTMYAARPFVRYARENGKFIPKVREDLKEGAKIAAPIIRARMARRAASYGLAGLGGAAVGSGAIWAAMRRRNKDKE